MTTEYDKFVLADENKENDLIAEVNWNLTDAKSNHAQLVRFTFPDGKQAVVKRDLLNAFLFTIGKPEDQRKMIPQKIQPVHHYEQMLGILAKEDIPKGGQIKVKVQGSIPCLLTKEFLGDKAFNEEVKREMARKSTKKLFMG